MNKILTLIIFCFVFLGCNSNNKEEKKDLTLIPVKSGEYWGYINHEGKIIINPQFSRAFIFSEDIALIKSTDDKFGYIDETGKFIVTPTYKSGLGFSEGLAAVVKENSQIEYIDHDGKTKLTLAPDIESAFSFKEGLAAVVTNGRLGYIDKTGKIAVPCIYTSAGSFYNGLARVSIYDSSANLTKYGYIDTKGEIKINCQFNYAEDFKSDIAVVYNGKQFGYIDKKGNYVINPQFSNASNFDGDFAYIKQGELFGYINKEGKIVINPQFKSVDLFYNNDVASVTGTDGKYGFIDKEGKYIINPQFEYVSRFYNDISIIKMADKIGLIDKKGKIIVNPQFDNFNVEKDFNTSISSDYFDVSGVVNYILEGTNENTFNNFSTNETFKTLKAKYPTLNEYNYNSFSGLPSSNNKFIKLNKINLGFNDLYKYNETFSDQQVYDPVNGGYTTKKVSNGTSQVLNEDATVPFIALCYYLNYKATAKKTEIVKELTNKLTTQYNMSDTVNIGASSKTLKNINYKVAIDPFKDTDGNNLVLSISFNK